ncbi:DUF5777 family beta-barrel protein [Lacibacter sp.]|uniref:DUF5777 family beta-barrel protein n=1 Tax=Lacibacter sp. TaxID=1915409 RepID=UPI002B4B668D|nr:DUF5777 family beta-barrel protein [Lacibacter sp.]HLP39484.1 DUF5777 family beta-barrel protein [Lacibacter sp.]
MTKILLLFLFFCTATVARAQDESSLLNELEDDKPKKEYISNAFKSSRVINGHSMEFIGKGVLDFRILHRFGRVNQGASQLFGLDQASMRMGFDYGLAKNLTIGIGRSTLKKELDGFIKYRPVWQSKGPGAVPFSLVLVAGMSVHTLKNTDPARKETFTARSAYYYQVIVGRKFSERFSLQLSPTLVHRNYVDAADDNDIYALGIGGRWKLTKRMAIIADYFYPINGFPKNFNDNPLSVGIDVETGGHVFQLHFSNTAGMNERSFITETTDRWGKGDLRFGFNLSRVFTLDKRRKVAVQQRKAPLSTY